MMNDFKGELKYTINSLYLLKLCFILVLKVKFSNECESSHSLFYKQNQTIKDQCDDKPRTLFVLNVPPYCNEVISEIFFESKFNIMYVSNRSR